MTRYKQFIQHTSARTIMLLLEPDSMQLLTLTQLAEHTCSIRNRVAELNQKLRLTNAVKLHHLVYYKVKHEFPTAYSDTLCQCIRDVASKYKSLTTRVRTLTKQIEWRSNNGYKTRSSIVKQRDHMSNVTPSYISRDILLTKSYYRVSIPDMKLTIANLPGLPWLQLAIANTKYNQQQLAKIQELTSKPTIRLVKDKQGRWFLHLPVMTSISVSAGQYDNAVGIDLGITDLVVSTLGILSNRQEVERVNSLYRRYQDHISRLQSNGSRSAKRRLKKTSGRRRRLMSDLLHCISKNVVMIISNSGATHIVMEKLKGIRDSAVKRVDKRMLARWCYARLQELIAYKAGLKNITVAYIYPAHTSTTCSKCTSRNTHRDGKTFVCYTCGHTDDADINASYNIRDRFFKILHSSKVVPV